MLFTIFSVFYVLIAVAMIVLILMQRGEGADAGASFGGGASGTVFGARGSANFLTRTTAVLATVFFILSIGMGIYLSHHGTSAQTTKQALGIMAGIGSSAPPTSGPASGAPPAGAPGGSASPASSAPVRRSEVPAAPTTANASQSEVPAAPTSANSKKSGIPAASAKKSPPKSSAPIGSGPPASH